MSLWLGIVGSSLSSSNPGMVLLKPTSIDYSGTSASIGTNGQVTFEAITSLSLNGVFTADFNNYIMYINGTSTLSGRTLRFSMRSSGSNNSTTNSYVTQRLSVSGSSVSAARETQSTFFELVNFDDEQRTGYVISIYNPFLSKPTIARSVSAGGDASAVINDYAATHNVSSSYDGFTFVPSTGSVTGKLSVYGVRS